MGAGDQWDVDFLGRDDSHLHGSTSFILKVQTHKTLSNRYRSTSPNFTFFLVYMRRGTFLSHASGVSQATVGFITPYHHLSRSMCQKKTIVVCIFTRRPKKIISDFTAPSQRLGDNTSRPGASRLTKKKLRDSHGDFFH